MSHPFGDLITQHLHRKHSLSQAKLAEGILQDPSIIGKMCKGQRLNGPHARERVCAIIDWLRQQGALNALDEANALLSAAGMTGLRADEPAEVALLDQLSAQSVPHHRSLTATTLRTSAPTPVPGHQQEIAIEPGAPMLEPVAPTRNGDVEQLSSGWPQRAHLSPSYFFPTQPKHNLPAQTTPLIGRAQELADLAQLLVEPATRLVTILGAGGIGKTRLSIAVAAMVASQFADGVCFVPLADVETPQAILPTIATKLKLPDVGAVDARQLLYNLLRTKNLLLVLDNLEHLIDGSTALSDLLQQVPHLTLLVTSQERLNLVEEWLYPLEGLSYPSAESFASSAEYGAITLFVQCTRKSRPDFDPALEWSHIAAICRLVEGLPLGIELAASWVRIMSCAEIADQLAQDADFLTSPLRNLPTRHRSLRALIERSWQLLTLEEQVSLRQLAVFRSGFDRQAAETVAGATPTLLAALVDKSLIRRQPAGRFDMHGLLHHFAADKLADVPQLQTQVRARHAAFYADLAARAGWELEAGENSAKKAIPSEASNLLAAWRWATETQNQGILQRMVKPLANYYVYAGWQDETRRAFAAAIQALRDAAPNAEQPCLLGSLLLRMAMADPAFRVKERYTTLSEAVRLLEQASPRDDLDLALAYGEFAMASATLGHNQAAAALLEKALALVQSAGSALGEGYILLKLGLLKGGWGRMREGTEHLEKAIRRLEGVDSDVLMHCNHILGATWMTRGFYQRAETLLQQGLTYAVTHLRNLRAGYIVRELAQLKTLTGNFPEALHYFQEAHARLDPLNLRADVTVGASLVSPAVLARLRGEPDAEQQLVDAVATARQLGFQQRFATALHHLSRLRHEQHNYEGALALLEEAITIARQIDFRYATSLILVQQGHSWMALNQPEKARRCYAEALQIASDEGIDRIALDALCGIATLLEQAGNVEGATSFLELVHDHPASEYETRCRADERLNQMSQVVSVASTEEKHHVDHTFALAEAIRVALQWLC